MNKFELIGSTKSQTVTNRATAKQVLKVAQALSDPVRVRLLAMLLAGRAECCQTEQPGNLTKPGAICVCDIMSSMNLIQSKVSYHLAKLKAAGLVQEEKRGRWNYYSANREAIDGFTVAWAEFVGAPYPETTKAD